jgi:hypothetical protein
MIKADLFFIKKYLLLAKNVITAMKTTSKNAIILAKNESKGMI